MIKNINQAYEFLASGFTPEIAVVLGWIQSEQLSGVRIIDTYNFSDIPGFPDTNGIYHKGVLNFCEYKGKKLAILNGRYHCYEGVTAEQTVIPIRTLIKLGAKKAVLTNMAGGITYKPGDIVLINDHINLTDSNCLTGVNMDELGPRFPDMSDAYAKVFRNKIKAIYPSMPEGVYAYMSGPSFETPAEIRALKILGADLVGMSTVHEAVACAHAQIPVAALSCVTNYAAGLADEQFDAQKFHDVMDSMTGDMSTILKNIIEVL